MPEPEVTLSELQARRLRGYPVSIDELALAYLDFARDYYRKNGRVTREAEIIGAMLRVLVRQHSGEAAEEFGPVKLKELRERMIDEVDWCRKHINKQISRLTRMFKWAVANELIGPSTYQALHAVAGLKRGRSEARKPTRRSRPTCCGGPIASHPTAASWTPTMSTPIALRSTDLRKGGAREMVSQPTPARGGNRGAQEVWPRSGSGYLRSSERRSDTNLRRA